MFTNRSEPVGPVMYRGSTGLPDLKTVPGRCQGSWGEQSPAWNTIGTLYSPDIAGMLWQHCDITLGLFLGQLMG